MSNTRKNLSSKKRNKSKKHPRIVLIKINAGKEDIVIHKIKKDIKNVNQKKKGNKMFVLYIKIY